GGRETDEGVRSIFTRRRDVSTRAPESSGETQAQRLERVAEQVARLLREPGVAARLRTSPGADEGSAMQTLGHMTEMIRSWLSHCRTLIAALGPELPRFGRTRGAPERLAGVAHGATSDPDALLRQLQAEVRTAAGAIRAMTARERDKRGVNPERGEVTVAQVV